MTRPPTRPDALANKIFRGSRAIKRGLLTRAQLRSSAWRPLFRDVYADAHLVLTHRLRCRAASRFLLPDGAAIAGRSAASLFGVPYVDVDAPVEVVTPRDFGPVHGLTIRRGPLGVAETVRHGWMVVTSPLRTAWDIARWLDVVEAVVFLDALASKRSISAAALVDYGRAAGAPRVRTAAGLIDAGSESPQESRLRVKLVLAGLPAPVAQHVIIRDGRFIARVDLAWPELKIAIEYDGRWHADLSRWERDQIRLNQMLGADWLVFHVTAKQMRDGLDELIVEIRRAIRIRRAALTPAR